MFLYVSIGAVISEKYMDTYGYIMAAICVYLRLKKERHSRHIGTRQYRSPEVVLGLPWDEKTDVARLDQRHCFVELFSWQSKFPKLGKVILPSHLHFSL